MAETILLKHQNKSNMPMRIQYFYDGRAVVRFGVIELPVEKSAWIDRAFMMGFRLDPETDRPLELADIRRMAAGEVVIVAPAEPESTESAGEDVEGTDTGGQPSSDDGVRESELPGSDSLPEEGLDGSVSDGVEALDSGDEPASD